MKKHLFLILAAALCFGCAKDQSGPEPESQGKAYLALSFLGNAQGKAGTNIADPGTSAESKMGTATVLLFDNYGVCLGSVNFTQFSTSQKEAQEVPSATTKIVVVINNYAAAWNLSSALVKGRSWDEINTFMEVSAANIATDDAFMMSSSGDNVGGAMTNVTVYKTANEATAAPTSVKVDRVSSRVKVTSTNPTATNGAFVFGSWELNTTNKTARLYSERLTYPNAETTGVEAVYRKDKNYLRTDFPIAQAELIAYMKANYNSLSNGTSAATMSPITRAANAAAYCAENTMEADAQLWGHTTKVVIKGQFTPTGLTANESYFGWGGNYYNHANMKLEYKKVDQTNLKTDLIAFLVLADDTFKALSADNQKVEANIDAAIDRLDNYSGIKAKYQAVTYFYQATCYYEAAIRHDGAVTTPMALGRYGVVRNNSYEINITAVKGPGTPWIPDVTDPGSPTDPTDPDDKSVSNLSIIVTVNPWTHWVHNVELGG